MKFFVQTGLVNHEFYWGWSDWAFFFLLWTSTLSIFRSPPLGNLDSSENKISAFCLENISLNASILRSTGKWLELQHPVCKLYLIPLFSVKYNGQEIPPPEIPCLALSSVINLSLRLSCVSDHLYPVVVTQQGLWPWKNYYLWWFLHNQVNTNDENVSCILWVVNSRTAYIVFSGC